MPQYARNRSVRRDVSRRMRRPAATWTDIIEEAR